MKRKILQLSVLALLFMAGASSAHAKKVQYTVRIYTIIYNGDTLQTGGDVVHSGVMKKHSKRLPIATLDNGESLHLEMWITMEGVMLDRFNVFQHKYYTKNGEAWRLVAVTPRLKFYGSHYDRGHYSYTDPQSGETLEVMYQLTVDPYKKKKKK
ncbi:MAG: hypothetical protein JJ975_14080 [Bacteroidia bacterium]|nr:hypothetical protein [Bacteroidia bacterium]